MNSKKNSCRGNYMRKYGIWSWGVHVPSTPALPSYADFANSIIWLLPRHCLIYDSWALIWLHNVGVRTGQRPSKRPVFSMVNNPHAATLGTFPTRLNMSVCHEQGSGFWKYVFWSWAAWMPKETATWAEGTDNPKPVIEFGRSGWIIFSKLVDYVIHGDVMSRCEGHNAL